MFSVQMEIAIVEAQNAIKADDNSKDIRIYFLTAVPIAKVESMMDETNADGVIQKPFNLSDLNLLFDQL